MTMPESTTQKIYSDIVKVCLVLHQVHASSVFIYLLC